MTKKRTIDPRIRASETFACLTYRQRDLWMGLILVCDDQGRLPGQAAYVRSTVWPYDDVPLSEVDGDLAALESLGNILRYRVDGRTFIQLVNWHKYQADAEWLACSEYPAPEGWMDHARYHGKKNVILTLNWENRKTSATLNQGSITKEENQPLPLRDVNGDVKDDGNGDDDCEDEAERENTPQAAVAGFSGPVTMQEARAIQGRIRMATSKMCKVTSILEGEIAQIIYKYPEDWIMDAIHTARINQVPKWAYVLGVLKNKAEAASMAVKPSDYAANIER